MGLSPAAASIAVSSANPVGLVGLKFEHEFRVLPGKPIRAAILLVINGLILLAGEFFRRKASVRADREIARERDLDGGQRAAGRRRSARRWSPTEREAEYSLGLESDRRLVTQGYLSAFLIGAAQILALLAALAETGWRWWRAHSAGCPGRTPPGSPSCSPPPGHPGRWRPQGAQPDGPAGQRHPRPGPGRQRAVGCRRLSVGRFLVKYFRTLTLTPFAIYCIVVGLGGVIYLGLVR